MPPSATMPQHRMLPQAHPLRIKIKPEITSRHHQLPTVAIKTEQDTASTNDNNNSRTRTYYDSEQEDNTKHEH
jgi:hypothetical protein